MKDQPEQRESMNNTFATMSEHGNVHLDSTLDLTNMNGSLSQSPDKSSESKKHKSVLDELDCYWQEYDNNPMAQCQFGIMKRHAEDMLLLNSNEKKKGTGAFCIGI